MKHSLFTRETLLENKRKTRKVVRVVPSRGGGQLADSVRKNRKKRIDAFK